MIAQLFLSAFLMVVLVYAWSAYRTAPLVGLLASLAAIAGLYFVLIPEHASVLAGVVGIGRGTDLILYTWVAISLLIMLNLHIKLRVQLGMITRLARAAAIERATETRSRAGDGSKRRAGRMRKKVSVRSRDSEASRSAHAAK